MSHMHICRLCGEDFECELEGQVQEYCLHHDIDPSPVCVDCEELPDA